MMSLNGYAIHVREPVPVYTHVVMYKKHRKKNNHQQRVKVFSHWSEIIEDGQVISDDFDRAFYMNRRTFEMIKEACW